MTLFCTLEFKISTQTLERAYEDYPQNAADGTIKYYEENIGEWDSVCSQVFDTPDKAFEYYKTTYPTTWNEEETRITMQQSAVCHGCKSDKFLYYVEGHGKVCDDCRTAISIKEDALGISTAPSM